MKNDLVLLYTGNGKGKTSAAIGQVVRALGHEWPVAMIQFVKQQECGEHKILADLPGLDFYKMGCGFIFNDDVEKHRLVALDAWKFAENVILAGKHRLVVLDELTYLIKYGFLVGADVARVLRLRPKGVNVVMTGRTESKELLDVADLVSEILPVKHPYERGIPAQKGIEF